MPEIIVEPPGPKAKKLLQVEESYAAPPKTCKDLLIVRGKDCILEDADGNKFLDFASGVTVMNVGHCHPEVVEAIKKQADKLLYAYMGHYSSQAYVELLDRLMPLMPEDLKRICLYVSGTEAIEAAVRLSRAYTKKYEVMSFYGAYHGRTYMSMSLSGHFEFKESFGPMCPGVIIAPYAYCYRCAFRMSYPDCNLYCVEYLDQVVEYASTKNIGTLVMEPVQAWGGGIVPPQGFIRGVRRFCDKHGVSYVSDEIQTFPGRTGKLFAFEHSGAIPDMIAFGKGLGGGMPISAHVSRKKYYDVPIPMVGSTFSANPVSCASALAALNVVFKERLVENAAKMGEYLWKRLKESEEKYDMIGEARGLGLWGGIELVKDPKTKEPATEATEEVLKKCLKKGLYTTGPSGPFHNVIRIMPPLTISRELIDKGVEILEEGFKATLT